MSKIDVDGIIIKSVMGSHSTSDGYGSITEYSILKLKGELSKDELIKILIRDWIAGLRCDKCGRAGYCAYRSKPKEIRHPIKKLEEDMTFINKCGVIKSILINFIESSFPYLLKMDKREFRIF